MRVSRARVRPQTSWTVALLGGAVASLGYAGVVAGYSLLPASNVDLGVPVWWSVVASVLLSAGAIGVPVALWLRYRLRSPVVLLAVLLLFWHVLVEFPPVGSGQGDSPGFLFVFVLAPLYVVAYGLLAGAEFLVRERTPGRPHRST